MVPPSISKFGIKENRKTRSNGLPKIDHSLSPEGLCARVAEAGEDERVENRQRILYDWQGPGGEGHAKVLRG